MKKQEQLKHALHRARQTVRITSEAHERGELGADVVENARAALRRSTKAFSEAVNGAPNCDRDIAEALDVARRFGGISGEHHKEWVIDQMVRALAGSEYASFVAAAKAGEDGPETYAWSAGIAP